MNTIVIEILRNGQVTNQLLQKSTNYIALCGAYPAKDFTINCDQQMFNHHVKFLRYDSSADGDTEKENEEERLRQSSILFFQDLISGIIDQIYPEQLHYRPQDDMLHLRLVTTPKEIAQLPFEMALTPVQLQNVSPRVPFLLTMQLKPPSPGKCVMLHSAITTGHLNRGYFLHGRNLAIQSHRRNNSTLL